MVITATALRMTVSKRGETEEGRWERENEEKYKARGDKGGGR